MTIPNNNHLQIVNILATSFIEEPQIINEHIITEPQIRGPPILIRQNAFHLNDPIPSDNDLLLNDDDNIENIIIIT